MADLFFDTTILIDLLRDRRVATDYLDGLPNDTGLLTHAMVQAEVLQGIVDAKELGKVDRMFRKFALFHANEADSAAALTSLRRLHLSHQVGFPDCLIAATCIRLGLALVTLNVRHFRLFKGLIVIRPY